MGGIEDRRGEGCTFSDPRINPLVDVGEAGLGETAQRPVDLVRRGGVQLVGDRQAECPGRCEAVPGRIEGGHG